MNKKSSQFEKRHDRDLREGIVPAVDSHEEQMRKLKAHLTRPILPGEASGEVRLNGDALRRHADLDRIAEHPMVAIRRRLREERESA
jgi:hypothetical protein